MAYRIETNLFDFLDERELGDLNRLVALLEMLPAEPLLEALEAERAGRRNDNPVRRMWYCLVAATLYGEGKWSRLRAELARNQDLRRVCDVPCVETIPSRHAFKRFAAALARHQDLLEGMLAGVVARLSELLPDLGRHLAVDSSGLMTHTRVDEKDGRLREGSWGAKTSQRVRKDGTVEEVTLRWFGFKLHLLVDALYEVPLAFEVTEAKQSDMHHLVPLLVKLRQEQPQLETETVSADKGYDSAENVERAWREEVEGRPLRIKAVIAQRESPTPDEPYQDGRGFCDLVLRKHGALCCQRELKNAEGKIERPLTEMAWAGFEADRECHKFRCPAKTHGLECRRFQECNAGLSQGRTVRVACEGRWRTLPPLPVDSPKWERIYKGRTSVERAFGRLKGPLGLEELPVRSKAGVTLRATMGLLVLVALAVCRVRQGQTRNLGKIRAA
ncbi:transposase [bacterium]|nr:transposase [bacterium]